MTNPQQDPSLTRQGTFKPENGYTGRVQQQGAPVFDVTLNDQGDYIRHQVNEYLRSLRLNDDNAISPFEFLIRPVTRDTSATYAGQHPRNSDNVAVQLGRLQTRLGLVDARILRESGLYDAVAYDYKRLVDLGANDARDHEYGNYLFKGAVTALGAGATQSVTDENKKWTADHHLLGVNTTVEIPGTGGADLGAPWDDELLDDEIFPCRMIFTEPACRVVFLTGANAGAEREISVVDSTTKVSWVSALASPLAEDDEYVIVPGNNLAARRAEYDAASASNTLPIGLTGMGLAVYWVHVYLDTVSGNEDPDLVDPNFANYTEAHALRLRWCLRCTSLKMSARSLDGTYDFYSPLHYYNQWVDKAELGEKSNRMVEDGNPVGTPGTVMDASESLNFYHTQDLVEQNIVQGFDETALMTSNGLLRHGYYMNAEYTQQELFELAFRGALDSTFTALTEHAAVPVLMHSVQVKTNPGDTLSPYWYPNLPPLAGTEFQRFAPLADPANPILYYVPKRSVHSQAELSRQVSRAQTLNWEAPTGSRQFWGFDTISGSGTPYGALVEQRTAYKAPAVFKDMADHISFLDTVVLGLCGLGHGMGAYHESLADTPKNPPTTGLFDGDDSSWMQSGHSNSVYTFSSAALLNPSDKLRGTVYPPDVLVGGDMPTNSMANTSTPVTGPGEYVLRDGTTITPGAEDGWSFYKDEVGEYTSPGNPQANFDRRRWDEGLAQATAFRESLKFRKLAIKTFAHAAADLFTIDVSPPTVVTKSDESLYNYGLPDGFGACAVGALQDSSNPQTYTPQGGDPVDPGNPRQVAHASYDNVGAGSVARSNFVSPGEAGETLTVGKLGNGGSNAIEKFNYGDVALESDVEIDLQRGAWNRFSTTPNTAAGGFTDTPEMLDQWKNRCTAMRLRYHVGDFYPAPDGSNALVDTLNLFVRAEPLPLALWMVLPKHQHSLLESTIPFADALERMFTYMLGTGKTDHLINVAGTVVYVQADSPAIEKYTLNEGDPDPINLPFHHKHQPYTHWFHPLMEYLDAPHPYSAATDFPTMDETTVYNKFGARSMFVPALGNMSRTDTHNNDSPWTGGNTLSYGYGTPPTALEEIGYDHVNRSDIGVTTRVISDGFGNNVSLVENEWNFPYNFDAGTDPDANRVAGPVFLPAMRTFVAEMSGAQYVYGIHKLFLTADSDWGGGGAAYTGNEWWPLPDSYADSEAGVAYGTPDPMRLPAMRAAIRTDTVAAIVDLVRTTESADWVTAANNAIDKWADELAGTLVAPISGPDFNADSLFVGDAGTSVSLDSATTKTRPWYLNPLAFGIPARYDVGKPTANADYRSNVVRDIFELAVLEREEGYDSGTNVEFLPLLQTFHALRYHGMQQKLLFNSSLRVLHARPGGGYSDVSGAAQNSAQMQSLTELFIVRDRVNGSAVALPNAPDSPTDKPFLHFESMHPVASGGGGYPGSAHPNNAYVGHLYGMISDSAGGSVEGANDELYSEVASPDNKLVAGDFAAAEPASTASMGDSVVGDPFDYAYSKWNADQLVLPNKAPKRDRLFQNSGIEIDLVSELRFVLENQATHGIDQAGFGGTTWADMMPSVAELTAPGDHEIIFVLYTGSYGQKMVDDTVPDGYNPSVAGCHLVASIEVNRPNAKRAADHQNYGVETEPYHVLGHN